jgi:hypothetical protein
MRLMGWSRHAKRVLAAVLLGVLVATAAVAAQKRGGVITRDQSRLLVRLPDLLYGREMFFHFDHTAVGYETYYAALLPNGGVYPRIQAYYDVATGDHSYVRKAQLNEAWLRRLTSFFNEKVITLQSSETLTGPERATIAHFSVDRSDCFAFAFLAGDTGPTPLEKSQRRVRGYYCSGEGGRLSSYAIEQVLDGIQTMP